MKNYISSLSFVTIDLQMIKILIFKVLFVVVFLIELILKKIYCQIFSKLFMDYLFNNSKICVNINSLTPSFRCFIQVMEVISTTGKKNLHFNVLINIESLIYKRFFLNNKSSREPTCNYLVNS